MGNPWRNEHGSAWWRFNFTDDKPEGQRAFKNVPRFVIGMVDVQVIRPATSPLPDIDR